MTPDRASYCVDVYCVEVTGSLEIDYTVRDYCALPYPGHPEGCPHFGKRKECPPSAPLVKDFIDLSKPHYFMVADCDFSARVEEPRKGSKDTMWYWNEYVEPILCEYIKEFQKEHPGTVFTLHPSAVGVDVFKTAQNVGISLESTIEEKFCRIALTGYPI